MPNPDVPLAGEIIEDDWGAAVVSRLIPIFGNVAARDTDLPAPQNGRVCYTGVESTFWVFYQSGWIPLVSPDGAEFPGPVLGPDGDPTKPTFGFVDHPGTGLNASVGGDLRLSVLDKHVVTFGQYFMILSADTLHDGDPRIQAVGNVAGPGYAFRGEPDSGMYRRGIGEIGLGANGVEGIRLSFDAFRSAHMYNQESGSAANLVVTGGAGLIARSTSSRRYKSNIVPAPQLADYALDPVTFHHDGDDRDYVGFVAEDVAAQNPDAGEYNDDGDIESYDLRAVAAILAAKVNRLETRVAALEAAV